MIGWLDALEDGNEPPTKDYESDDGLPIATGPNGERVHHVNYWNDEQRGEVEGATVIFKIECR